MSRAALISPCSRLMLASMRVTRARSTSTKICRHAQLGCASALQTRLTLPSVTVLRVSITLSFTSVLGTSGRNPITICTIFVMACLSCPCFLLKRSTCSFNKLQSLASLDIVTTATMSLDVEARSDDCRVCFSSCNSLSMEACVCPD